MWQALLAQDHHKDHYLCLVGGAAANRVARQRLRRINVSVAAVARVPVEMLYQLGVSHPQ